MFLKTLTTAIVLALLWQMCEVWGAGRKLAVKHDQNMLAKHRRGVALVGALIIVAVVLTEIQVRKSPNPYAMDSFLIIFHLIVVAMLVLVFAAIIFRFTGLRNPNVHSKLAYAFYVLFLLALGTGSVMLYRLPV